MDLSFTKDRFYGGSSNIKDRENARRVEINQQTVRDPGFWGEGRISLLENNFSITNCSSETLSANVGLAKPRDDINFPQPLMTIFVSLILTCGFLVQLVPDLIPHFQNLFGRRLAVRPNIWDGLF